MSEKNKLINHSNDNFDADRAPIYSAEKKPKRFLKQGKLSFMDEFYSIYRKWIKRD